MLSVSSVYDFRRITADVKGVFAEEFRGERQLWEDEQYSFDCRKCGVLS
ncbi:MAG: hypothetical protein II931_04115 [Clostridia bacterium]|nr:hypothetical protein [Clostridia bacterium]